MNPGGLDALPDTPRESEAVDKSSPGMLVATVLKKAVAMLRRPGGLEILERED